MENSKSSSSVWATGRRKTSVARVRAVPQKAGGKVLVNNKPIADYFAGNKRHSRVAMQSLELAKVSGAYDVFITVEGGGITGQAEAIRHGIARVFVKMDETLKTVMRKAGFLTRDPRAVERKKSGQPGARKRFQYSKR